MKAFSKPYLLNFYTPAGTSRGVYHTRKSWYLVLEDANRVGIGECAPLPQLSCDHLPIYEEVLNNLCLRISEGQPIVLEEYRDFPSILFGLETALRDLEAPEHRLWDTPFSRGAQGIAINGLIWMGTHEYMLQQIDAKIAMGFRCLKLKVGAIDFEQELNLVRHIRSKYPQEVLQIRLDANGGFTPANAQERLNQLSKYCIHSIEQPIRASQIAEMGELVRNSPIPIALDEELIGIHQPQLKQQLLEAINPHYIILKPSLHGGLMGCREWIDFAEQRGIGWWVTSALESNVGLNAIAQWCASLGVTMPQGLGTGMLYTNNIASPLYIEGEELRHGSTEKWDLTPIVG